MKHLYNILLPLLFIALCISCGKKRSKAAITQEKLKSEFTLEQQDSLMSVYLRNGAWKKPLYSREWQEEIDKGLAVDPTIAYFWQQKAMPLFKQGKYELALPLIDQAVKYDPGRWQSYRAFMKCIFAKQYRNAIVDFEECKKHFGNGFVMDHTYDFYIALSYLQLNEFEKAEKILEKDHERTLREKGEEWLHHLDLFYYGISKYELKKYDEALALFDKALELYPQFSDVQYYKARILSERGKPEEAREWIARAKENANNGYSINEDSSIYERYPYQVRWSS